MPRSPEEFLISAVLNNKDIVSAFAKGMSAELFHTHDQEWVWLEDYYRKYGKVPSNAAFTRVFPSYRHHRTNDLEHFCDEVRQGHVRFELTEVLNKAVELLSDGDIDQAARLVTTSMVKITAGLGGVDDPDIFTSYSDILQDVQNRVSRAETEGYSGVPTGITSIDDNTGGLNPGEFIIVAARLGHAKSWTVQSIAAHATAKGFNVQFDALEQTRSQVAMRVHTLLSGSIGKTLFQNTALMQGKGFNLREYEQFLKKLKSDIVGKLNVADATRGRMSPLTIAAQIERNHPDLVIVDYLTLMQTSSPDWMGVATLSNEMKQLGGSYEIPILAAAQTNRENGLGKGEPPDAEALAKSDAIGQDCDMLITQRQRSKRVIQQKMAKYRNGPGGFCWWIEFDPSLGIFREVTSNRAQQIMDADADEADARSAG